jgi:hypothetical protein
MPSRGRSPNADSASISNSSTRGDRGSSDGACAKDDPDARESAWSSTGAAPLPPGEAVDAASSLSAAALKHTAHSGDDLGFIM